MENYRLGTWASFGTSFHPKGNSLHILPDKALLYYWLIRAVKGKTELLNVIRFIIEWIYVQCYLLQLVEIFPFVTFQPLLFILLNKNKFKRYTLYYMLKCLKTSFVFLSGCLSSGWLLSSLTYSSVIPILLLPNWL